MRPIDADAFKNYIQSGLEDVRHLFKDNGKRAEKIIEGICEDIDDQPTIELPKRTYEMGEVVTCKECKHRHLDGVIWNCPFGLCGGEDFFCAYGAKDGDSDDE